MAKILNGKIRVLVVDNDEDMCWLIASILKEEGLGVDIAHDVKSALSKITHHQYEVMVLDYKLSGMSGLTVLEKTHQIKPTIVTVMISAFGNESVKAKAKEFGAYTFLDKPFNIDTLKWMVKKALTEQKRRCANEANLHKLHSRSSPDGSLGFPGFCSGTDNGSPKDRHSVHIGAS
ncbi:response regulator [Candidatus Collierbacteria bacterium]|nr:response regulator [Candidatus Collierbacteria bacterium]